MKHAKIIDVLILSALFFLSYFYVPLLVPYLFSAHAIPLTYFIWISPLSFLLFFAPYAMWRRSLPLWSEHSITLRTLTRIMGVALLVFIFLMGSEYLFTLIWRISNLYVDREQHAVWHVRQMMTSHHQYLTYLGVSIISPLAEECFFRSVLLSFFLSFQRPVIAFSWVTLIFSTLHLHGNMGWYNLELFWMISGLSVALSYLFLKERAIFSPFCFHAAFNTLSLLSLN